MHIVELSTLNAPGVEAYSTLTEAQLRNRLEPEKGIFIAESPKVIAVALDAGFVPLSLLCEQRHIEGDAAPILHRIEEMEAQGDKLPPKASGGSLPIYTGSRELLARLTGYTLTRGVLCAMRRPLPPTLGEVCRDARRIVVVHGVVDSTNVGAIFRSAAALGIDAVVLTPDSCDPLNRRAVRVSMGSVFLLPWTWAEDPLPALHAMGFLTVAMALTDESIPMDDPSLRNVPRMAIIMGTEGDGLPHSTIAAADRTVRIPMKHGVDSLNVAAAAAVAFWELRDRG
ncbi:MAG: RNA methyltransferase [Bacteroidaceae bacterium]|nr:RNA methyltransferase [Bacteroidaceae bacterium]